MTKEQAINTIITSGCNTNEISDGYHTFGELYEHRIALFIALCREVINSTVNVGLLPKDAEVWRSEYHSDGSKLEGWFVLGIFSKATKQITYHLPMSKWTECDFAETLDRAPEWDGHTSQDVLDRLKEF